MSEARAALVPFGSCGPAREKLSGDRASKVEVGVTEIGKEECEELGRNENDGQYFASRSHSSRQDKYNA